MRMRVCGLWILIFLFGCLNEEANETASQVEISSVGKSEFLIGECTKGNLPISFAIENRSALPARVRLDRAGCSCLGVKPEESTIGGGGRGTLDSSIQIRQSGALSPNFLFDVQLGNTRPVQVAKNIELEVLDPSEVRPSYIHAEFERLGDALSRDLEIHIRSKEVFEPTAPVFKNLPPEIQLETCNLQKSGFRNSGIYEQVWKATFSMAQSPRISNGLVGNFIVETGESLLDISYNLYLNGGIKISPTSLIFDSNFEQDGSDAQKREVVLRARDSKPFRIVSCSINSDSWRAVPLATGERMVHVISVSALRSVSPSEQQILEVITTHALSPEISVNVSTGH
jgi:hypothetical protein